MTDLVRLRLNRLGQARGAMENTYDYFTESPSLGIARLFVDGLAALSLAQDVRKPASEKASQRIPQPRSRNISIANG